MKPLVNQKIDHLNVSVFQDRNEVGIAAAYHVKEKILHLLNKKSEVRMIFAAAASQREFLSELLSFTDITWEKVVAFQMDEYHTLEESAPQRFSNFLQAHFFKFKNFKNIHFMSDDLNKYESLITSAPIDIVCLGIGENGHLAFNDPPVADFHDPKVIKEVELDLICRQQQVNDGEFQNIDKVPEKAVTLTIPTLMKGDFLSVVVPGPTKAKAIEDTLFNEVSAICPATILRTHKNAKLFLDLDSAKHIVGKIP